MSKTQQEITKKLAAKHKVSILEMTKLLKYPFKYTNQLIKEGNKDKFLYNGFGKFSVKPGRVYKLNKNNERSQITDPNQA